MGKVSDVGYCWQVMYDATGVRLQAGRQAEVWLMPCSISFFLCQTWDLKFYSNFSFSVCLWHWLQCNTSFLFVLVDLNCSLFYWVWMTGFSQVLNQIVYELPAEHPLAESRPLRELLGHTPPQVHLFKFDCFLWLFYGSKLCQGIWCAICLFSHLIEFSGNR